MSPSLVFRSKCHRSTFCLYCIWQLTFIASYLGNLTFPKVQTILFLNTLSQTNNLLPFSRKSVLLYFFNPVQFEYLPLPLKPHNFKSMCRISKIITFLESLRQADWFDLFESDIQALLIFDPLITLWGNFDAPYLKLLNDASVASACFYVRTCRRVRNSKKIATIRDFHLPGSFLCLSTRLWSVIQNCCVSSRLQHKPTEYWSSACKQRPITQNLSGLNTGTHGELLQVTL